MILFMNGRPAHITILLFSLMVSVWCEAREMTVFDRVAMSNFFAKALADLPGNQSRFQKVLAKVSPSDAVAIRQILREWSIKKMGIKIDDHFGQVVFQRGGIELLTVDLASDKGDGAVVIVLNGSQKITIQKDAIVASLTKGLKENSKSATVNFDGIFSGLIGFAYADSSFDVDKLSGLGQALVLYSGVAVASSTLAEPPWEALGERDYGRVMNFLGGIKKNVTCDRSTHAVSGEITLGNHKHIFTYDDRGFQLDGKYRVSVNSQEEHVPFATLEKAIDTDYTTCMMVLNQVNENLKPTRLRRSFYDQCNGGSSTADMCRGDSSWVTCRTGSHGSGWDGSPDRWKEYRHQALRVGVDGAINRALDDIDAKWDIGGYYTSPYVFCRYTSEVPKRRLLG